MRVAHRIPYSDLAQPDRRGAGPARRARTSRWSSATRSSDQIGGQLAAGFVLAGFYEDIDPGSPLARRIPSYIATRAVKPGA